MDAKEIQDWLITHIARVLSVQENSLDIREPLANYGLSSQQAVSISGDLEDLLQRKLPVTLLYEYPTIELLARHLDSASSKSTSASHGKKGSPALHEPIAIVGLSCRFPKANDAESFWQLLRDGVDAISQVPSNRWDVRDFFDPDPSTPGKSISYWGGFLDQVDQFDPFFFGISPVEARQMDPQQRLLMELSYEALEDAGLTKENVKGTKTGVFVGISMNEYSILQLNDPLSITSHSGTGSALSIAANRISYFYDLNGPSMAVDTACSSSLVAVHLACQSIQRGESEMAIAGGVNLILSPAHSIAFTKAGLLAPDGRCKTFDSRANGYVRGEGGGLIILKPLSKALEDEDRIYAVIHGSAMNQDGRSNGLMAPSPEAQERLLREAYANAQIDPGAVGYVEAHGTGTLLGDEIESRSIGRVIGAQQKDGNCKIGSVKTNIGHLEAAAGIAGLIKVALSLKYKIIPPTINFQSPNPHVAFDDLNLEVATELAQWTGSEDLFAGVNSFGFGGTNVHIVVGSSKLKQQKRTHSGSLTKFILPLSAGSFESLKELAFKYTSLIIDTSDNAIADVCYAASTRRNHLDHRLIASGDSASQLKSELQSFISNVSSPGLRFKDRPVASAPRVVFVFSGQGGQWIGMGRELLKSYPVFRDQIEKCHSFIEQNFGWSLIDLLTKDENAEQISDIGFVQPVLFSIQIALARLWQSWNVAPDILVGHSMGEVAAAHISGALSLEDAIRVICRRSKLLRESRGQGMMMVTELSGMDAEKFIKPYSNRVSVAAFNSPQSTVLSGEVNALNLIGRELEDRNLFCQTVNVDIASHSDQMDRYRDRLINSLKTIKPRSAKIPMVSTVTASQHDMVFNAGYWFDNLRKPVLFLDSIQKILAGNGPCIFIEIGPHPVLLGSIQQTLTSISRTAPLLPSMHREIPESNCLLTSVGLLHLEGVPIDWKSLYAHRGNYVKLPSHPWNRQRYWVDANFSTFKSDWLSRPHAQDHPLLGQHLNLAESEGRHVWQAELDLRRLTFLTDHKVRNEIIFPAAAFIEIGLAVAREVGIADTHQTVGWSFQTPMVLKTEEPQIVQTFLEKSQDNEFKLTVFSRALNSETWITHATTDFSLGKSHERKSVFLDEMKKQMDSQFAGHELYQRLSSVGIDYGPVFQSLDSIWMKMGTALGKIKPPAQLKIDQANFVLHPALLDSCLQVISATGLNSLKDDLYLPVGCGIIRRFAPSNQIAYSYASYKSDSSTNEIHRFDIQLLNDDGEVVVELIDFSLQRIKSSSRLNSPDSGIRLYQTRWENMPKKKLPIDNLFQKRSWLILGDSDGYGEKLTATIEACGDVCYFFRHAEKIERNTSRDRTSTRDSSFPELPADISEVIYLTNLSIPAMGGNDDSLIYEMGVNGVMHLAQSLIAAGGRMPRLWIITKGALSVTGMEDIAVEQSPVWGLGKVIAFEIPDLKCIRIDLDPNQNVEGSVQLLMEQLKSPDNEDQIAFRENSRYVQRIFPYKLVAGSPGSSDFKSDKTYLITGGLGGLGLNIARWMVRRGARNITLLSRSKPNDHQLKIIESLKGNGAQILLLEADVAKVSQVLGAFEKLRHSLPALKGIIHAAGILDDAAIVNLDADRMRRSMAAKTEGTWNLHQASQTDSLDFFVLFSSAVSVLGSPGQGNYAAASAFLDSFAHYRSGLGLPALSINWGPWAEVGLAAAVAEKFEAEDQVNERLIKSIKPSAGLDVLDALLGQTVSQVTVLPFDLTNLLELYPPASGIPFFERVLHSETFASKFYVRPRLRQDYVAPGSDIEKKLSDLWQQTLHIDRVGIHDSFFELGGDSVLAAQILTSIQKSYKIRIDLKEAFKAFTVERLAMMVEDALIEKISTMTESDVADELTKSQPN